MNPSYRISCLAQFARKMVESVHCSNMTLLLKQLKDIFSSQMSPQATQHCVAGNMLPSSYGFSKSVANDGCEPVPGWLTLAHIHSAALPVVQSPFHPICPAVFPQATHIPKSLHLKSDLRR
jgi:hypothetical protein